MIRQDPSKSDIWFAWFPVRLGALSIGHWIWLEKVWRNKCAGVTIYQSLKERQKNKVVKEIKKDRKKVGYLGLCPTPDMHIWVRAVTEGVSKEEFCMRCCEINFDSEKIDLGKLIEEWKILSMFKS